MSKGFMTYYTKSTPPSVNGKTPRKAPTHVDEGGHNGAAAIGKAVPKPRIAKEGHVGFHKKDGTWVEFPSKGRKSRRKKNT